MPECLRYTNEILAWEYDQRNHSLEDNELQWYLKYANKYKPEKILELACGSGRITIPFVQAGYEVDALDISSVMLDRLKTKLTTTELKNKINIIHSDMLSFTPKTSYGMVFLGYNSIRYLETRDNIRTLFHKIYNDMLSENGIFLFLVVQPDFRRFKNNLYEIDWLDRPIIDDLLGISVGSKMVYRLQSDSIIIERTYDIRLSDGQRQIIECKTISPLISYDEYIDILSEVGFKPAVFDGYKEEPITEKSKNYALSVGNKFEFISNTVA